MWVTLTGLWVVEYLILLAEYDSEYNSRMFSIIYVWIPLHDGAYNHSQKLNS